jgi:hypothetical protein
MNGAIIPRKNLGRTEAFLSYDSLAEVNAIDKTRQFKYATRETYIPSAEFHNRGLILGIVENSAREICYELKLRGYIGLVEIEIINPRMGVNQIQGRPVVVA